MNAVYRRGQFSFMYCIYNYKLVLFFVFCLVSLILIEIKWCRRWRDKKLYTYISCEQIMMSTVNS